MLSSGEAKSGFPVNFFTRKRVFLLSRTSQSRESFPRFPMTFYWFYSNTFGDLALVLVFVGLFGAKDQRDFQQQVILIPLENIRKTCP